MRVHARAAGGRVAGEEPFRPFILLAEPDLLDGLTGRSGADAAGRVGRLPLARILPGMEPRREGARALPARLGALARRSPGAVPLPLGSGAPVSAPLGADVVPRHDARRPPATGAGHRGPYHAGLRVSQRRAGGRPHHRHRPGRLHGVEHGPVRRGDGRGGASPRVHAPDRRARPGRPRGAQHLPLRPRVPGGARAPPSGGARLGPRRLGSSAAIPRACRSPSAPSPTGATAWRGGISWTPGCSPSSTTWPPATSTPTGSRTWPGTSASPLPTGRISPPRTSPASSARTRRG